MDRMIYRLNLPHVGTPQPRKLKKKTSYICIFYLVIKCLEIFCVFCLLCLLSKLKGKIRDSRSLVLSNQISKSIYRWGNVMIFSRDVMSQKNLNYYPHYSKNGPFLRLVSYAFISNLNSHVSLNELLSFFSNKVGLSHYLQPTIL